MSLASFGVRKPVPVRLLMMAVIAAGVYFGLTMQREFFPESTPEQARITLPYPGATPQEIEESMARKVEDAVADLDEVEKVITTISEGGGGVVVEFRDGVTDIDKAVKEVEDAVDALTDLPEDADEIRVSEFEPQIPVIMVTLYGDADEEIMKQAIRRIRDDFKTLPGMGDIVVSGVRDYEIRVDIASPALLQHGISLPQVSDAIARWMDDIPGGSMRTNVGNVNVRTMGVVERAEAIRAIVVKATPDGQSLRVGDIATVKEGFVDDLLERRFNGRPAVSLTVFKTGEQDAIDIAKMVRAYVAGRMGEAFPGGAIDEIFKTKTKQAFDLAKRHGDTLPGMLATHSDLARFIEGRLDLLTENAQQGAILIFLTIFLGLNFRAAWWVMLGLFTAICGTLILMTIFGVTLNLLTMFGLLITLGMLEDDAIVVSENILARFQRGEPAMVAAIKGAEQVFWPVVGTVLTTIVAFLPLTMVQGRIGDLLGALPWVVLCSLLTSLMETMLMLPSHMAHSLTDRDKKKPGRIAEASRRFEEWRDRRVIQPIIDFYGRFVAISLEYRYITTVAALFVLIVSLGMVAGGRPEFTFLPDSDSETIVVDLRMPIGTSIGQTQVAVDQITHAAQAQPEIKNVSAIVGQRTNVESGVADASASHFGQMFIELIPVETRQDQGMRESSGVIEGIRQATGVIENIEELRFSEISGGPGGADITIQVTGDDDEQVNAVADEFKEILAEFQGVYDIADDNFDSQREIQIELKPGGAALGFSVADVARQVRGALFGLDPHVFSAKREDIDVRVRLDEGSRRSLSSIQNMWVIAPPLTGREEQGVLRVPLSEIAELKEGTSFSTIKRIDRERAVTVSADTAPQVNPEMITEALTKAGPGGEPSHFDRIQTNHPTVGIEFAGRQRDLAKAFATLPIAFAAACLMIYVILAWLFSSYSQPFAVMLAIPFGVIGVVWGHLLLGYQLTFLSLIGFVALAGVVVNNSLILVEFYNDQRAKGMGLREALIDSGRKRLRAISLTSITTVVGLSPLILERSFQAKFLIPMAISISFGLISATVLTLMVLPCLIVIFDDAGRAWHYLWHGAARGEAVRPHEVEAIAASDG